MTGVRNTKGPLYKYSLLKLQNKYCLSITTPGISCRLWKLSHKLLKITLCAKCRILLIRKKTILGRQFKNVYSFLTDELVSTAFVRFRRYWVLKQVRSRHLLFSVLLKTAPGANPASSTMCTGDRSRVQRQNADLYHYPHRQPTLGLNIATIVLLVCVFIIL
jgi:hypothetical protein